MALNLVIANPKSVIVPLSLVEVIQFKACSVLRELEIKALLGGLINSLRNDFKSLTLFIYSSLKRSNISDVISLF